jgi:hypothetical protein
MNKITRTLLATLLLTALLTPVPAAAQAEQTPETEEEEEEDEEPVVDLTGITEAIEDLTDELQDFTGNWDTTLKELLIAVIFHPFKTLAQQLLQTLALVLTHTPDIHPNPAVEDVHSRVLQVTYLLSGLGFMTTGILYITGPLFGISYTQVRMAIPRMIAALVFSTVSLPLLQYTVELSNALVHAFAPTQLAMNITQLAGLSTALVLAWVVNASLLLVVVVMFIIRDVYLLFVAAISPLLALTWSIPPAKRYADTFIAGWWTALAMAPLDVLVLRFSFELLNGNGSTFTATVSNWILGVASFTLLILVPYQLYGASQAAIGQAYIISQGIKKRADQGYKTWKQQKNELELTREERNRVEAYRQRNQEQTEDFRSDWSDDDDD